MRARPRDEETPACKAPGVSLSRSPPGEAYASYLCLAHSAQNRSRDPEYSLVFVILGLYGPMGPNLRIHPLPLLQLDRVFAASEAGQA